MVRRMSVNTVLIRWSTALEMLTLEDTPDCLRERIATTWRMSFDALIILSFRSEPLHSIMVRGVKNWGLRRDFPIWCPDLNNASSTPDQPKDLTGWAGPLRVPLSGLR